MAGLLTGLLGIAALPPIALLPAGLIWLVPWLMALHASPPRRVVETLVAIGLPAGFAIGPVVIAEPRLTLVVIGATLTPFILTALLATDRRGRGSPGRLIIAVIVLCGLLAGVRALGLPLSLSLFLPTGFIHLPLIGAGGILASDLAIGLLQTALAILLHHRRARAMTPAIAARFTVALFALLPLALVQPPVATTDDAERARIAVIQTNITPRTRHQAIADGGLEGLKARQQHLARTAGQLDADWIIWPEAASPGFLGPDWRVTDSSATHLRHGYRYHRPGRVESEVRLSAGSGDEDATGRRWGKHYPLPFAERDLSPVHQINTTPPDIDALEVLICSDGTHPGAVDRAAARRPRVILNPASVAYLGSIPLPGMHQRSVHLQSARVAIAMIVVANAGPSAVLYPDGRRRVLAAPYTSGVAALPLPDRYIASDQDPGVLYGLLATGFVALGGSRRMRARSPARSSPRSAWPVVGLAAASIGIAIVLQHRSLEKFSSAATPALATPLETRAIHSPAAGHRGSIALLAREFGVATDWQAVPASVDAAMGWLCRQTGLIPMDPMASSIRPPAFGLQQSTTGLRAVRWRVGAQPIAFDASTAEFQAIEADDPAIHWLATARTLDDCRSVIAPE
ncbi:hypothetical protein [Spiribacter vilamensis]|uniref:Apolipoprotein N-acyltransferase n=1 Tax=Spiribacter vilamensis TaxID=531306 RepID=A0A4Q8D021_9GAMM|nr:hypothetical protein [Spiribacter vilamensis]RZU98638.1 apolipoprotein N-acyltransferase [Spiribacter vilamensis]TVO60104.1 hypothetical protein FPL09_09730 [Spiribacter vilamensis]